MKYVYLIILCLIFTGCGTNKPASVMRIQNEKISESVEKTVFVKLDFEDPLNFQGAYDFDSLSSNTMNMMYPAYNGATFLVAILAHAATSTTMQNSEKQDVLNEANKIIEKYQSQINLFSGDEIFSSFSSNLDNNYKFNIKKYEKDLSHSTTNGWVVYTNPIFYLTQDEREIILKNIIYFHPVESPEILLGKNMVEVISFRIPDQEPVSAWMINNKMITEASELYANSLVLFIDDVLYKHKNEADRQKTFRYFQGGEKKFERGNLVKDDCDRLIIRNLRGGLISIPKKSIANDQSPVINEECPKRRMVNVDIMAQLNQKVID